MIDLEHFNNRMTQLEINLDELRMELTKYIIEQNTQMEEPPEGFKFTGEYRLPQKGEWVLWYGSANQVQYDHNTLRCHILKKLRRIVFEETREVRKAVRGEWYLNKEDDVCECFMKTGIEFPILRKIKDS